MKSNRWMSLLLSLALGAAFFTGCFTGCSAPSSRLSDEEIKLLRKDYPIYTQRPALVDMTPYTMEDIAVEMDTAIYGKALSESTQRSEKILYEVEVIQDVSGTYQPGDSITISIPSFMEGCIPEFEKWENLIILGQFQTDEENVVNFADKGLYYVTKDGYALSSFEETENQFSGMTAEDCVKQLYELTK